MNDGALKGPHYNASSYQMIRSIDIRNFRCFEHLEIDSCSRINVIVGDNGSGKTALLEAIFFALGSNPNLSLRFRQQRGLEGAFNGPVRRIEEAIWRDYFYNRDWKRNISIRLTGDGPEARSITISRGRPHLAIPLEADTEKSEELTLSFGIAWRDSEGVEHKTFPTVTTTGLEFEGSDEDLEDFFLFPANQTVNSIETAGRFSALSRVGRDREFIDILTKEYRWLEDLSVEVIVGSPALFATVRGQTEKRPLADISGGINRMVAIMLAIASRQQAVVLVDEIENGLYFKHQAALWRGLLALSRNFDTQLIVTTHSEEWLEALVDAASGEVDDLSLWRTERSENGPVVHQFTGKQVSAGIKAGEVR